MVETTGEKKPVGRNVTPALYTSTPEKQKTGTGGYPFIKWGSEMHGVVN
jgi:hypothetical protein